MLHYSGSKKNKLWIWKAYKREMDELMDWECGGRDKETLSWLVERLSKWNVKMFCANNHAAYCEVLDEDKLFKVNLKHFILSKITAARDTGMCVLEENP